MTSIIEMCQKFLSDQASLDELRDWLAVYQWSLKGAEEDLADAIDVAIVHLDDGYSDEYALRYRFVLAIEQCVASKFGVVKVKEPNQIDSYLQSTEITSGATYVLTTSGVPTPYNPTAPLREEWQPV